MKIEGLYIYPIKSANGLKLTEIKVGKIGLENDRYYGIANAKNEIVTARENADLLKIKTQISNGKLSIIYKDEFKEVSLKKELQDIELLLFQKKTIGKTICNEMDKWLTGVLKTESKLVKIDFEKPRKTDVTEISFNDVYPIHLVSQESVEMLNKKLENPIEVNRFRPNIIVSGFNAFEEEKWTDVVIGECEFKVVSKTERCSLITIDPLTGTKHTKQEPLRTLAKEFKSNGKVNFGVYLIPTKIGAIKNSDVLKIKQ